MIMQLAFLLFIDCRISPPPWLFVKLFLSIKHLRINLKNIKINKEMYLFIYLFKTKRQST